MTTVASFKERMGHLKTVKAGGGAFRWFKPGKHRVKIDSIKVDLSVKPSKKGKEYLAVGATVVVTDSTDPDMQPGKTVDWSTSEDKASYEGNVKQLLCAVWNTTEQEFDDTPDDELATLWDQTVGVAQVAVGRLVDADVQMTTTLKGGEFTAVRWMGVGDDEQVAEVEKPTA